MTRPRLPENKTVLFAVTSSQSLKLLGKIPGAMAGIGWDVHVVGGGISSALPEGLAHATHHSLPMVRNPSPLKDLYALVSWLALLKKVRPSIVVIGTPKAALLGMVAALICRVPVRVYQLRGLRAETTTGWVRHLLLLIEWVTATSATTILAPSRSLKDEYCRLGLSKPSKIEVLGLGSSHGVDVNHFHPRRWSTWEPSEPHLRKVRDERLPTLGFVGRFSTDKGVQELLHSSKLLLNSGFPHVILIVGPIEGDEVSLSALLRSNHRTILTGPVEDVAPYYSLMDLLILPTHREGFPNVVLEAAASGVPSVTTNATGAVDSVVHGVTGVLVPARDGDALAAAIRSLLCKPQLIKQLGFNARNWSISHFNSDLLTKKYCDYLVRMVEAKGVGN